MTAAAAGPWTAVSDREPPTGTVVLARWAAGAIRVVEWSPKALEGKSEGGHRVGDGEVPFSLYMAHTGPCVLGFREWPTHWAELYLSDST